MDTKVRCFYHDMCIATVHGEPCPAVEPHEPRLIRDGQFSGNVMCTEFHRCPHKQNRVRCVPVSHVPAPLDQ